MEFDTSIVWRIPASRAAAVPSGFRSVERVTEWGGFVKNRSKLSVDVEFSRVVRASNHGLAAAEAYSYAHAAMGSLGETGLGEPEDAVTFRISKL